MDSRDWAAMTGRWYDNFDQKRMIVEVELYDGETDEEYMAEFPAVFDVCSLCEGQGSHVNPSIDAHGISAEEFYEDPGFAEDYFSGVYDVTCYECKGLRVAPQVDTTHLTDQQKKDYDVLQEKICDDAMYAAECAAERRMGC
jgi:hypothetical protein